MLAKTNLSADADTKRIIMEALEDAVEANFNYFGQIEHAARVLQAAKPDITAVNALSLVHRFHYRQR